MRHDPAARCGPMLRGDRGEPVAERATSTTSSPSRGKDAGDRLSDAARGAGDERDGAAAHITRSVPDGVRRRGVRRAPAAHPPGRASDTPMISATRQTRLSSNSCSDAVGEDDLPHHLDDALPATVRIVGALDDTPVKALKSIASLLRRVGRLDQRRRSRLSSSEKRSLRISPEAASFRRGLRTPSAFMAWTRRPAAATGGRLRRRGDSG